MPVDLKDLEYAARALDYHGSPRAAATVRKAIAEIEAARTQPGPDADATAADPGSAAPRYTTAAALGHVRAARDLFVAAIGARELIEIEQADDFIREVISAAVAEALVALAVKPTKDREEPATP